MSYTCEYCGEVLCSTSSLQYHQKTAKYCLMLRGQPSESQSWDCNCGKSFSWKTSLTRHQRICLYTASIQQQSQPPMSIQQPCPSMQQQDLLLVVDKLIDTIKGVVEVSIVSTQTTNITINIQPSAEENM